MMQDKRHRIESICEEYGVFCFWNETSWGLSIRVVDKNGRFTGCLCIIELCENKGYLQDIFVKQEYRGTKLGRLVVSLLHDICYNLKISFTELKVQKNSEAIKLYEKAGYRITDIYNDKLVIMTACHSMHTSNLL